MSAVLTGPNKGTMEYTLPEGANVQMIQEIVLAIRQLDFPIKDVKFNKATRRIEVEHKFTVKASALILAMTQLDTEITVIVNTLRNRKLAPVGMQFSSL